MTTSDTQEATARRWAMPLKAERLGKVGKSTWRWDVVDARGVSIKQFNEEQARAIVTAVNSHSTLTEENARLSIRVKEMEERETPGASEAFTALDLADNLIERSYGTDVPVEWKRAIKKVVRARTALEQSK